MAMTTESMQGGEVVTDIRDEPKPAVQTNPRLSVEAQILFNKSIVARPLMAPEAAEIHIKHTEYRYRWVFTGSQGLMYTRRISQGFTNASTEDVDILVGNVSKDDGSIRCGDLILMKIPWEVYDAAIKNNMIKAATLSRMKGVYMDGPADPSVFSDSNPKRISVKNEPFMRGNKVQLEIPDDPDRMVEDSIKSGRAAKTRQVVEKMREQHAAR